MNRLKMMWLVFKFMMRDDIMQAGAIMMINGMFYSFIASVYGPNFCNMLWDLNLNLMYVLVIPAYIWFPRTIKPEIVTIH